MKEQSIQKNIINYLESKGAYTVKVISATKKGVPDIIASVPTTITQDMVGKTIGVFHAYEVKKPETKNNASPLQLYNIDKINKAGGIAKVVWSKDQISI
jgi:Holliday junction resolvase